MRLGVLHTVILDSEFDSKMNIDKSGYVRIYKDGKKQYLHRYLTGAPKGMVVDHINGNKLDNRLSNLRVCTQQQNSFNREAKGVFKIGSRYQARIMVDGKFLHIGMYDTEEEAQQARIKKHIEVAGKFSPHKEETK